MNGAAIAHRLVTAAIITNLPVAAWAEISHCEIAEHLDMALLAFFACEVLIRVSRAVIRRQWDEWLAFDGIVVAVALLPLGASLPVVRGARLLHLGRHFQHLRHLTVARVVLR